MATYSLNWDKMAEIFDEDKETLKRMHEEGVECPECGEHLENLGVIIEHEH